MEEEFIRNQERLKPQEEKNEEERSKVDDLRGIYCSLIIQQGFAFVSIRTKFFIYMPHTYIFIYL